jgi:hypothetical protein
MPHRCFRLPPVRPFSRQIIHPFKSRFPDTDQQIRAPSRAGTAGTALRFKTYESLPSMAASNTAAFDRISLWHAEHRNFATLLGLLEASSTASAAAGRPTTS